MAISADIYGQQITPKFNSPFEALSQVLTLKNQQEGNRALVEQRQASAEKNRQEAESKRQEAAAAAQVRALFNRTDPATGQPVAPQMEELAGIIGPEKSADIFKGFEALRTARSNNAIKDTERIAAVLGGVESMPGDLRAQAYDGALQMLTADGTLKPGQAPPKYDANFVKAKRREALSVLQQFEQDKAPADYTLGDSRISGATNQPIATAAPKPTALGSDDFAIERWAAARKLDPRKLSSAQIAAAKREQAMATRAPDKPDKPTYEWAQTAEGTRLLTPQEIRAQGATKPITATDKGKYKNAEPVLRGIEELSEKINTQQGLIATMKGGAAKIAAQANYDDDVAEYDALVSGFTPLVARALGHTGVLTQQDVDSVKALFPLPRNSKTLRDRKIKRVRGIFNELEGADIGAQPPAEPPAAGGGITYADYLKSRKKDGG